MERDGVTTPVTFTFLFAMLLALAPTEPTPAPPPASSPLPVEIESPGGCTLDFLHGTIVLPDSLQIVASYQCGRITCWEKFVILLSDNRRLGLAKSCAPAEPSP